jgi:biopolymer transport protein ExbB
MKKLISAIAIGLALMPGIAAASWWSNDWKFRKELTFDLAPTGADIAAGVGDAPVLLRLSTANFSYFGDTKPDGTDLRIIADDDKTPLKYHVEKYDPQSQMAFIWVRLPKIAGGKQGKAFLYYGNSDAPNGGDVPGTYDADQVLALHFGGDGLPEDATGYHNNATASTATAVQASFAGAGISTGAGRSVKVGPAPALALTASKGYTATAWVKIDTAQPNAAVVAVTDGAKSFVLGVNGTKPYAQAGTATVTATADVAAGEWHFIAATAVGGQLILSVDGIEAGKANTALADLNGVVTIGADATGARPFAGEIDEVGLSKVGRAAEWTKAMAKGGVDGGFIAYGADGQKESGGGSYFVTIAKNLTADGWFVIGLCMFMLVCAIIVMVMKAVLLGSVEKANAAFRKTYAEATDITGIDNSDDAAFKASTLRELYDIGAKELYKRVPHHAPAGTTISEPMIEAIRASMDAAQARIQQKLSARMVLLTIAISGGPFLGLLGTVIGVMITFAAIAASGDVNVNAIAPGTAAALAATVAGLLVAIPCLFGYNWLNTRIKAVTTENRVFTDEVVTRIAEQFA